MHFKFLQPLPFCDLLPLRLCHGWLPDCLVVHDAGRCSTRLVGLGKNASRNPGTRHESRVFSADALDDFPIHTHQYHKAYI